MAYDELVTFEQVEVLAGDGGALRVRVDGLDVWVANEHMAITDGVVGKPGDCGRLIIPRWIAIGLGLLVPAMIPSPTPSPKELSRRSGAV